jgi:hypothetical protein
MRASFRNWLRQEGREDDRASHLKVHPPEAGEPPTVASRINQTSNKAKRTNSKPVMPRSSDAEIGPAMTRRCRAHRRGQRPSTIGSSVSFVGSTTTCFTFRRFQV